jgi:hypothetical protein
METNWPIIYNASYKGIYYKYSPNLHGKGLDIWELSENQTDTGFKMIFNANVLRLDQCFKLYQEEWEKDKPNREYGKYRK